MLRGGCREIRARSQMATEISLATGRGCVDCDYNAACARAITGGAQRTELAAWGASGISRLGDHGARGARFGMGGQARGLS